MGRRIAANVGPCRTRTAPPDTVPRMRPAPSRPPLPVVPSTVATCATAVVALCLGAPTAAHAAPAVTATAGAAGPPALAAWVHGTEVRVATTDGATRTVARLRSARTAARLTLDRQGRRVTIGTPDGLRVLDLERGGPPSRLTPGPGETELVSWSPDGRELLAASQDEILRCTLSAPRPCRTVATDAASDGPPTWSPDGASFAYVTQRAVRGGGTAPSGIVTVTGGARTRLESVRPSDRSLFGVAPPVWSAAGPLWATAEVRAPRPSRSGREAGGSSRSDDTDSFLTTGDLSVRYRLRAVGADGRAHTLGAGEQADGRPIPPVPMADGPSGPVGMSFQGRIGAPRATYRVGRIAPGGAFTPIWTTTVRPTSTGETADDAMIAGVLADGTVVVRRGTLPSVRTDDRLPVTELRALDGPTGRGRLLVRGRSATLASPYPSSVLDLE
jgi:hypothetical protein